MSGLVFLLNFVLKDQSDFTIVYDKVCWAKSGIFRPEVGNKHKLKLNIFRNILSRDDIT